MKKYTEYGWLRKLLQDFDMFKSPANLRMKQQPDSSQYCSGIFSILQFAFLIFILISQFIKVLNYDSIVSISSDQSIYNLQKPFTSNVLFAFSAASLNYDEWVKLFDIQVYVLFQQVNSQGTTYFQQYRKIELQKCRKQQWQNYTNIYDSYKFQQNLCVKNPQQIELIGTQYLRKCSFMYLVVQRCNLNPTLLRDNCLSNEQFKNKIIEMQKNQTNYFSFYIVDTLISADKQDPINKRVRLNNDFYYTYNTSASVDMYLGMYSVQTDTNLFPFLNSQVLEGYYVHQKFVQTKNRFVELNSAYVFGQISVLMKNKKKVFKRKVGKIDEVISYAGGIFGLLIAFFSFIINSYNEYSYELKVAESSFNYDEHGKQIKQKHFHFLKYIKFSIYDWVKFLFCYEINWKYDKRKDQTRQEANCTMDVMNLYKKIQIIQIMLEYFYDKNELILLYLTKPPTIKQLKQKRQRMGYYNKIIRGQIAINAQDIIRANQSLQMHRKSVQKKYSLRSAQSLLYNSNQRSLHLKHKNSLDSLINDQQQNRQNINREDIDTSKENHLYSQKLINNPEIIKVLIKKKFLKYSGIKNQKVIDKISEYIQIQKEAKQLYLNKQLLKVEQQLAMAYYSLKPKIKNRIVNKIPLKILHRLFDCLQKKFYNPDSSVKFLRSDSF